MSTGERDPYSGHMTTGHEWNGITELNTPVPKFLLACLGAAFLFAIGYWIMMPSWPGVNDYFRGQLGVDQRDIVASELVDAAAERSDWTDALHAASFEDIQNDDALMRIVTESGPALFRDNCSMCHGTEGKGGLNFPNLTDTAWLWGDDPESILKTLEVGINADHPETRNGQMPAFGKLGTLDGAGITNVVNYLRSLHEPSLGDGRRAAETVSVNAGKEIFGTNCAACHGAEGKGNSALGAPNLIDDFWLYGGDKAALTSTIRNGRGGHMPAWDARLSIGERKILSLYVLSLGQ